MSYHISPVWRSFCVESSATLISTNIYKLSLALFCWRIGLKETQTKLLPLAALDLYNRKELMLMHSCFSHVQLFVTPRTVAPRLLCPRDSPGKNTGVGCHALVQVIFLDPGIEPESPASSASQADSLALSHQGSPWWWSPFSNF